jgi:hypothetical protein
MADDGAMQPVRRPLRVVRIKNESESVANVQRIMQGPAYQEKERRAATRNAAGCGSRLSESDMELVRDQSRPRPCGRKRKVAVPRPLPCGRKRKVAVPADGDGKRGAGLRKRKDSAVKLPDLALVLSLVSWRCLPVTRIWQLLSLHWQLGSCCSWRSSIALNAGSSCPELWPWIFSRRLRSF